MQWLVRSMTIVLTLSKMSVFSIKLLSYNCQRVMVLFYNVRFATKAVRLLSFLKILF